MHVDVERCTYWRASLQIDAHRWTSIIQNESSPGSLIDIKVLLPNEDTSWEISVRRTIQQEFVDTSSLPSEKVKLYEDISEESLKAFDVLLPMDYPRVCVPVFWLVHLDNRISGTMKSILVARFLQPCWTRSLITLRPGECSKTMNVYIEDGRLRFGLGAVEREFQRPLIPQILKIPKTGKGAPL